MNYNNNIYNGLGKNGENFNTYVMPTLDVLSQAFQSYVTARYGSATTQQVVNNPNSQQAQDMWYAYQMSLMQNQQTQKEEKDNTMLYVALGIGALALIMMMNNSNTRR